MNLFQWIFLPPRFADDAKKTRHALLLHLASFFLFFIPLTLVLLNEIFGNTAERSINWMLGGIAFLQIPVQVLIRKGYMRPAVWLLLSMSWVALTWIASRVEGVSDVAVVCYFLILLGAGYLLGWRAVTLFTTWTILAVWVLAIYEAMGLLRPVPGNPIRIALDLTAIFILASLVIYFVIGALQRSLKSAEEELKERQRVETVLLEEREKLNLALHSANMETWEWDIETGTVSWSSGIEAMFGMEKGQFDGKYETFLSLIHPDDLPRVQQAVERSLSDESYGYVVEHGLVLPNGEMRWLEGRGKLYRDRSGKPVRMAGTVVDITDRKHAEAERERLIRELAAKNTELEQFTYTVSHDLKAPLITIKGFLGFLGEDARAGNHERLESDITRINEAVDKMHRLLNELLELSRIGRMMNPPQLGPFRELVDEAVEVLQGRLESTGAKLVIADDLPVVCGDRRRLLEVVQNLVDNAAKFSASQPAPMIEIGCDGYEKGMPVFFVRDNGIGIPAEHHERIFGLFNKLDPTVDGTGVGLALVKRIVEFHGGRVWVESATSPQGEAGNGATFRFALPLHKTTPAG
ncbi:MAG: PAS domain-containing protein [Anaerolineales bacterium]|nr:PAS domain-containing protein [Anaerolineales bacterium]